MQVTTPNLITKGHLIAMPSPVPNCSSTIFPEFGLGPLLIILSVSNKDITDPRRPHDCPHVAHERVVYVHRR